jgi:hypothetical protein
MNWYFLAAALLTILIGAVHSVLGEKLIFRRMRTSGFIPTEGGQVLREPYVRIIWASWHVVTVMGWCVAAFLAWGATQASAGAFQFFLHAIAVAMLASSILVLLGTKGRHPGWAGLLAVSVLVEAGLYA